jgi:uncharacterized protein
LCSDITVTYLMQEPPRPNSWRGPNMLHTKVYEGKKDDARDVAAMGFKAMMKGKGDVMSGCNYKRPLPISPPLPYLPSSTARRLTS